MAVVDAAHVAVVVVIPDRGVEARQRLHAVELVGDAAVDVLEARRRGGQEHVGPAVELVQRRHRRLQRAAVIRTEQFVARGHRQTLVAQPGLAVDVVGRIIERVAAVVGLARVAAHEAELELGRQRQRGGGAQAEALGAVGEEKRLVVVDQVREALHGDRPRLHCGAAKEEVAAVGLARPGIDAEDRALADRVSAVQADRPDLRLHPHRIESLLVLPPGDRADPALVVEVDPLAAERDGGRLELVLQLQPVEIDVHRIGHGGVLRPPLLARHREGEGVVVVDQGQRALAFDQHRQTMHLELGAGAQAHRQRVGVDRGLVDAFVAQAALDNRIDRQIVADLHRIAPFRLIGLRECGLRGGERRRERGRRQQVLELHVFPPGLDPDQSDTLPRDVWYFDLWYFRPPRRAVRDRIRRGSAALPGGRRRNRDAGAAPCGRAGAADRP